MNNKLTIKKGEIFGMLKIICEVEKKGKHRYFKCICECGNIKIIVLDSLIYLKTKSCGCYNMKKLKEGKRNLKHGMSKTKIYNVYKSIISRCYNKNNKSYKDYGGRGIECKWKSFEDFYKDLGNTYKEGLSLDRINNNGSYSKDNCRWTTMTVQCNNKRNNLYYKGFTIKELMKKYNLSYSCIYTRLYRKGIL